MSNAKCRFLLIKHFICQPAFPLQSFTSGFLPQYNNKIAWIIVIITSLCDRNRDALFAPSSPRHSWLRAAVTWSSTLNLPLTDVHFGHCLGHCFYYFLFSHCQNMQMFKTGFFSNAPSGWRWVNIPHSIGEGWRNLTTFFFLQQSVCLHFGDTTTFQSGQVYLLGNIHYTIDLLISQGLRKPLTKKRW